LKKVLIVEENDEQGALLSEYIHRINRKIRVFYTDSYEKAYTIALQSQLSAFVVNIQLRKGGGLEFAKKIRDMETYLFVPIIFIAKDSDMKQAALHDIHCYDYFVKPFKEDSVQKSFQLIFGKYFKQTSNNQQLICLEFKGVKYRLAADELIYIERRNRRILLVLRDEVIEYKIMSIRQFSSLLPSEFIQIHQSVVVNSHFIEYVDMTKRLIKLYDVEEYLPIGISYKQIILNTLAEDKKNEQNEA